MTLHILPTRTGGAAENMALDFLLLQRYPEPAARWRHYEWREPAFTFGFSQKIAFVREQLPQGEPVDLCRRPTGGGIVDHRSDWTYALVLPRGHALYAARATQSYRLVHECLTETLRALGQPAVLKTPERKGGYGGSDPGRDKAGNSRASLPAYGGAKGDQGMLPQQTGDELVAGVCFQRAEVHDVINEISGAKIAGAAQKRNKNGLLFQGSVEKSAVGALDWDDVQARFTTALAHALKTEAVGRPWPEIEEEASDLIAQYASPEWIEYR